MFVCGSKCGVKEEELPSTGEDEDAEDRDLEGTVSSSRTWQPGNLSCSTMRHILSFRRRRCRLWNNPSSSVDQRWDDGICHGMDGGRLRE